MDNVPAWLGGLGALFGVIVLVAAATAVIWSTAAQKRAEALEDTNAAMEQRIMLLELDKKDLEGKAAKLEVERAALASRVRVLEDVVTSKKELDTIMQVLNEHHRIVMQHIASVEREASRRARAQRGGGGGRAEPTK